VVASNRGNHCYLPGFLKGNTRFLLINIFISRYNPLGSLTGTECYLHAILLDRPTIEVFDSNGLSDLLKLEARVRIC